MSIINNKKKSLIRKFPKLYKASIAIAIFFICGFIIYVYNSCENSHIEIETNNEINPTPIQIQSIKNIGEWEFLSINDEELIDTTRHGFWGDDELVRIYYGTLRLGINLHEAQPGWIKVVNDSVNILLPPIKLLDKDFIDEAKTVSFFENGNWNNLDREKLYKRAHQTMYKRCMTPKNIKTAKNSAIAQFKALMLSLGFKKCHISFESDTKRTYNE